MSIIYEALKKTQASAEGVNKEPGASITNSAVPKPPHFKKQAILAITGAALGILFTWLITNKLYHPAQSRIEKTEKPATLNPPPKNKPTLKNPDKAVATKNLPQLLLSGTVLSEDGSIAMINDQICKLGDEIEGAKIVEITAAQVTLSFKNQEIILKNK